MLKQSIKRIAKYDAKRQKVLDLVRKPTPGFGGPNNDKPSEGADKMYDGVLD